MENHYSHTTNYNSAHLNAVDCEIWSVYGHTTSEMTALNKRCMHGLNRWAIAVKICLHRQSTSQVRFTRASTMARTVYIYTIILWP